MFAPRLKQPPVGARRSTTGAALPLARQTAGQHQAARETSASQERSPGEWDFSKVPISSPPKRGARPVVKPHAFLPLADDGQLQIGRIDDPLEFEAERMAREAVQAPAAQMRRSASVAQINRSSVGAAPPIVLEALRSQGEPLDGATRAYFEPRFGRDFGTVRVHASTLAAESARAVNAHAYTVADQLVFGTGRYAPQTSDGRRLIAHELAHVAQSRFSRSAMLMREPAGKPPVPKPGHTPFNFVSESPALENWKTAAKGVLEREFKMTFDTFEAAQEHYRKHLQTLPSDSAREDFGDRMRDRVRKAFYRAEGRNPSYDYKPADVDKLKKGAAPESGLQLEHLEDVKSKMRGGEKITGHPERALDPGNVYVTEGGAGGTAPKGSKHAEKYRTIEEAKKTSREIRERTQQSPVVEEPVPPKAAAPKPPVVEVPPGPAAKSPPAAAPPTVEAVPPKIATPPAAGPSPPVPAAPRTSPLKAGLKAGAGAAAWMVGFMALNYFVHKHLQAALEKEIEVYRQHMLKWAEREKQRTPDQPVYMQLIVESKDYSQFIPFAGWMPEPPVLHVTSVGITATPVDPPAVKVYDHSLDVFRPGKTIEVTYTELLIP